MSTTGGFGGLLWLLGGAMVGYGVMALPSIGLLVLPVAVIVLVVAGAVTAGEGGPLVLVGASLPLLWIAIENRGGPGQECWSSGSSGGCRELFDPWAFAIPALVLLALGVGLLVLARVRGARVRGVRVRDVPGS